MVAIQQCHCMETGTSRYFKYVIMPGSAWLVSKGFNGSVKLFGTLVFPPLAAHYM